MLCYCIFLSTNISKLSRDVYLWRLQRFFTCVQMGLSCRPTLNQQCRRVVAWDPDMSRMGNFGFIYGTRIRLDLPSKVGWGNKSQETSWTKCTKTEPTSIRLLRLAQRIWSGGTQKIVNFRNGDLSEWGHYPQHNNTTQHSFSFCYGSGMGPLGTTKVPLP